jgi:hypothetical protein
MHHLTNVDLMGIALGATLLASIVVPLPRGFLVEHGTLVAAARVGMVVLCALIWSITLFDVWPLHVGNLHRARLSEILALLPIVITGGIIAAYLLISPRTNETG